MNLKRYLYKNFAAQGFSQFSTVLIQFISIPIFLSYWGADRYGVWVLLSTIPAYLSLTDFGLTFIAKNELSRDASLGNYERCRVIFNSIFFFLLGASCFLILLYLFLISFLSDLVPMVLVDYRIEIFLLLLSAIVYQFMLLIFGVIRAIGLAHVETYLVSGSRVFDFCLIALGVIFGAEVLEVAFITFISKFIYFIPLLFWIMRSVNWLKFGTGFICGSTLKTIMAPSLSYMLVPISNAFLIQGPLLFLGSCFSPSVVASFSVMRTVSRIGTSIGNVINYVFIPSYSYVSSANTNFEFFKKLRIHAFFTTGALLLYILGEYLFGLKIFEHLSKGDLIFDSRVFWLLIFSVVLEMIWNFLFAPSSALSKVGGLPILLVISSIVFSLFASNICLSTFELAVGLLFIAVICTAYSTFSFWRLIKFHK